MAHCFDHFFLLIFPTSALAIAPDWGMAYQDVLVLGSPVYIMFALATLPAGWLGDKIDRMTLIAVFFLGCGASSLLIAASQSTLALSIGLGLLGMFAAIYYPVGLAQITHIGLRTERALAVNGVFGNMGLSVAVVVTVLLPTHLGWRAAFYVPGGLSILIGAALALRTKTSRAQIGAAPASSTPTGHTTLRATQIRVFAIVCVSALFGGLIFNAVTISLLKFFDERLTSLAGDLTGVSASAGLVFGIAAFAQLPVGELLDQVGARAVLLPLLSGQAICLLMLSQATGGAALLLALLLVTFVFAGIPVTTWLLGQYLNPQIRSRALSVEYVLSLGIGAAAVPLLVLLSKNGIGFAGQFLGLALAAATILLAALFLPRQTNQRPNPRNLGC